MKGNQTTLMRAFYEAGAVARWHTMPQVGGPLTVNAHSWGVAVFILTFHDGVPSLNLIKAALLHDAHERWSGDTPSPARRAIPLLQQGENEAQARFWRWSYEPHVEEMLEADELVWLRLADAAEAWLWTLAQMRLGNQNVARASTGLLRAIQAIVTDNADMFVDADGLLRAIEAMDAPRLPEALGELEEEC